MKFICNATIRKYIVYGIMFCVLRFDSKQHVSIIPNAHQHFYISPCCRKYNYKYIRIRTIAYFLSRIHQQYIKYHVVFQWLKIDAVIVVVVMVEHLRNNFTHGVVQLSIAIHTMQLASRVAKSILFSDFIIIFGCYKTTGIHKVYGSSKEFDGILIIWQAELHFPMFWEWVFEARSQRRCKNDI